MEKIIIVLFAVTMSWCVTTVVMAENNEQVVNDKKVVKTVRHLSSNERMMPAPEEQLKRLVEGLKLTVQQQDLIRPMLIEEFAILKGFRRDENLNPKQIQKKVEELRLDTVAKMKTALNPEQSERLDLVSKEIKENKQKRIKENRKSRIGTQADSPPLQLNQ